MIVSLIAALDEAGGIGKDNGIPWKLSSDLKRFKALTWGHYLIMGRKTYTSIGQPLPGRNTIIVSRRPSYQVDGCLIANSLSKALAIAKRNGEQDVFIIGGGQIFEQAISIADRLYLTYVHATVQADTFFPNFNEENWIEMENISQPADEQNQYSFTYRVLVKRGIEVEGLADQSLTES